MMMRLGAHVSRASGISHRPYPTLILILRLRSVPPQHPAITWRHACLQRPLDSSSRVSKIISASVNVSDFPETTLHVVASLKTNLHDGRMIMKKHTLRTYVILATGIVLVCAIVLFAVRIRFAEPTRQFTVGKTPSSYQKLKQTWEDTFNQTPVGAYAEFLKTANALPYSDAHSLAHIVGAILYDREGIAGLSNCTNDFAFGCYHGFAGGVIEKRGITGVGEFTEACKRQEDVTDCEHGIGHGLLAYLGSDELIDALELCPQVPSGTVGGCYNGVFMEYFLSILQHDEGVQ